MAADNTLDKEEILENDAWVSQVREIAFMEEDIVGESFSSYRKRSTGCWVIIFINIVQLLFCFHD